MRKNIFLTTFLTTMIVLALLMGSQHNASAAKMLAPSGGDISIDFVAAGPFSYDRTTGIGGQYDGRIIDKNTGVVESLEGGDFNCGDIVVFFDAITVGRFGWRQHDPGRELVQQVHDQRRRDRLLHYQQRYAPDERPWLYWQQERNCQLRRRLDGHADHHPSLDHRC